ncbi:GGDEF domain-containing protein [Euzebya tangerina]|uniref:GGDEF domain-containing protein n=1 Tax=Euzebya tangerina TaxID=591198 RepID=UPI000E31C380|nr:sensor domain-containing diguanylate cyclase [Euzebya tangerina]
MATALLVTLFARQAVAEVDGAEGLRSPAGPADMRGMLPLLSFAVPRLDRRRSSTPVQPDRRQSRPAKSVTASQTQSQILLLSARGLGYAGLLVLTPFAVNNLLAGRLVLGLGSSFIVAHLAFNAWTITRHRRYHHRAVLFILVPALLFFLWRSVEVQGVIGLLWCFPTAVALFFMLPRRQALLADTTLLVIILPTAAAAVEPEIALRFGATLSLVVLFTAMFVKLLSRQEEELRVQAVTDPLTGLFNRSLLHGTLAEAIGRNRRATDHMTLLSLDIDHFKRINDSAGHDVGDEVIRDVASVLGSGIRSTDAAFRVGGEEFVVLLSDTCPDGGMVVAERLRETIEQGSRRLPFAVTISLGVAGLQPDDTPDTWLKRADESLYASKLAGRNQVSLAAN